LADREINADAGRWLKTASFPQKGAAKNPKKRRGKMKLADIKERAEQNPFRALAV
jgi:hypothetical protein